MYSIFMFTFLSLALVLSKGYAVEEENNLTLLQNKVVAYVEEDPSFSGTGLIRVDVKKAGVEEKSYVFEFSEQTINQIEPFLAQTAESIGSKCSDLSLGAIGDFSSNEMKELIIHYFSTIEVQKEAIRSRSYNFSTNRDVIKSHAACFQASLNFNSSPELFYQLPLVDWEKKTIHKIVSTMADKNVFQLAIEKSSMEKKGKKIRHVHPLRFIGYIYGDGYLKKGMNEIKKNYFKWHSFVEGFGEKMHEEDRSDNLNRYIPGFSQALGTSQEKVTQYIQDKDWEGLLKFLM